MYGHVILSLYIKAEINNIIPVGFYCSFCFHCEIDLCLCCYVFKAFFFGPLNQWHQTLNSGCHSLLCACVCWVYILVSVLSSTLTSCTVKLAILFLFCIYLILSSALSLYCNAIHVIAYAVSLSKQFLKGHICHPISF